MRILLIILLIAPLVLHSQENDELIFKAMQDELDRSINDLRIDGLEEPYFIEYIITKKDYYHTKATLGAILEDNKESNTFLTVNVRVGDYKFDQTNFFDINLSFFGSSDDEERYKSRKIPYELDYTSLRRELWLATDVAYKHAAELYSKKKSAFTNRAKKDTIRDFLEPVVNLEFKERLPIPEYNQTYLRDMTGEVSSVFKDYSEVFSSSVGVEYIPYTRYYLNSEGTKVLSKDYYTGLEILGYAKDSLGMPLYDYSTSYSNEPINLPSLDSLKAIANQIGKNITALSESKELEEPYSGPVLFTDGAAAEIIAQGLGYNFVAQRKDMTEGGFQNELPFTKLQNKIGARVVPENISIYNITHLSDTLGSQVVGNYMIDDYGELPSTDTIVKAGYLEMLLSSRVPNKRVKESSASRRQGGVMFSTLAVENLDSDKALQKKNLLDTLLMLAKKRDLEYAIVVEKVLNQNVQFTSLYSLSSGDINLVRGEGNFGNVIAYKIYQDGRKELIKPSKTINFGIKSFKEIMYTGNDLYVYNFLANAVESPYITGGNQYLESTVITPSLLFEDCEIDILNTDYKKAPIVPAPLSSN